MSTNADSTNTDSTIRQIEFEPEKAEHGLAMPYDTERVRQLRKMLVEARPGGGCCGTRVRLSRASAVKRRRRKIGANDSNHRQMLDRFSTTTRE